MGFLLLLRVMPPEPLTNFEIQKYDQNEPKFSGVYSRNNSPKVKNGIYDKSWWVLINKNSLDCIAYECWKRNMFW